MLEERGKPQNPEKNLLEKRREPSTKATHGDGVDAQI